MSVRPAKWKAAAARIRIEALMKKARVRAMLESQVANLMA